MCPCKKEYLPPPDNLWFFLLLGFAIAVLFVFLLCELLKKLHVFSAAGNGAAYVEPVSKKVNPEFSDFLVAPAAAVVSTAAFHVAAAPSAPATKKSEAANLDASSGTTSKTPTVYTIPVSNAAKESLLTRKVKLRSALLANSSSEESMRTLDVRGLPSAAQRSSIKTSGARQASSSDSEIGQDITPVIRSRNLESEDDDELETMQNSEPKPRFLVLKELPDPVQRSPAKIQPSIKPVEVTSSSKSNQLKIKLRFLPASAARQKSSSDSEEGQDIAPVGCRNLDSEDDDELEAMQKCEPKPRFLVLKELPDPVQKSPTKMQTSITPVKVTSSTESNQLKLKLRSLPVKSMAAPEVNQSAQLIENTETQQTHNKLLKQVTLNEAETQREIQHAASAVDSDVQSQFRDLSASAQTRSSAPIKQTRKLVESLEHEQEAPDRKLHATTNGVSVTTPVLVQSEMLQSSQKTESRTMISTTETTNIRESQLNPVSLSRLRKREYELAALLRQLRTVESKVEHLSTELEKKDFLAHYRLSRDDLFQRKSPLLHYTETNNGFHSSPSSIQRNFNNESNYATITRSLVDLDKSHETIHQNSRIFVDKSDKPDDNRQNEASLIQGSGNFTQNGQQFSYRGASTELVPEIRVSESNGRFRNSSVSPNWFRFRQQNASPVSPTLFEQSNHTQRRVQYHQASTSPGSDGQYGDRYTASRNSVEGMESNLSEAIRQLRAECELKLIQNRDEQEAVNAKRESELYGQILKLANAFQLQSSEFSSLQFKLSSLEESLSGLNGQKLRAETRLKRMVLGDYEEQRNSSVEEINRLKGLILKMLQEKEELLSDFQHLQEAKTSLDTEIATYRALLDHEELRLDQIFQQSESNQTSASEENQRVKANGATSRNLLSFSRNQKFMESEI